jgi:hypothetical protein
MTKRGILLVFALLVFAGSARAQSMAGRWQAEVAGRGGATNQFVVALAIEGEEISGTLSEFEGDSLEITEAAIEDNVVVFKTSRVFGENPINITWTGTVTGNEMSLERKFEEGGQFADLQMPAVVLTKAEPE